RSTVLGLLKPVHTQRGKLFLRRVAGVVLFRSLLALRFDHMLLRLDEKAFEILHGMAERAGRSAPARLAASPANDHHDRDGDNRKPDDDFRNDPGHRMPIAAIPYRKSSSEI